MADRFAVVLCYYEAKNQTFAPFEDDYFWLSSDCNEIRAMPNYQNALEAIRGMIK